MIGVFVSLILFTVAMVVLLTFATITFKGIVAQNSAKCAHDLWNASSTMNEDDDFETNEIEIDSSLFDAKEVNITQKLINRSLVKLHDCSQIMKDRKGRQLPSKVYKLRYSSICQSKSYGSNSNFTIEI